MKKKPAATQKPRGGKRETPRRPDGEIKSADGQFLNKAGLAKELGVTKNWIGRRMRDADCLPHIKIKGSQRIVFCMPDVVAWLKRHTVQPAPTVRDPASGK